MVVKIAGRGQPIRVRVLQPTISLVGKQQHASGGNDLDEIAPFGLAHQVARGAVRQIHDDCARSLGDRIAQPAQIELPADALTADTRYWVEVVECTSTLGTIAAPRFPADGDQPLEARATGPLKVDSRVALDKGGPALFIMD